MSSRLSLSRSTVYSGDEAADRRYCCWHWFWFRRERIEWADINRRRNAALTRRAAWTLWCNDIGRQFRRIILLRQMLRGKRSVGRPHQPVWSGVPGKTLGASE
jgi:hypothetical protein